MSRNSLYCITKNVFQQSNFSQICFGREGRFRPLCWRLPKSHLDFNRFCNFLEIGPTSFSQVELCSLESMKRQSPYCPSQGTVLEGCLKFHYHPLFSGFTLHLWDLILKWCYPFENEDQFKLLNLVNFRGIISHGGYSRCSLRRA